VGGKLREDRVDSNGDAAEDISKEDQDVEAEKEERRRKGVYSHAHDSIGIALKEKQCGRGGPNTAKLNDAQERMNHDCMLCMSLWS